MNGGDAGASRTITVRTGTIDDMTTTMRDRYRYRYGYGYYGPRYWGGYGGWRRGWEDDNEQ